MELAASMEKGHKGGKNAPCYMQCLIYIYCMVFVKTECCGWRETKYIYACCCNCELDPLPLDDI